MKVFTILTTLSALLAITVPTSPHQFDKKYCKYPTTEDTFDCTSIFSPRHYKLNDFSLSSLSDDAALRHYLEVSLKKGWSAHPGHRVMKTNSRWHVLHAQQRTDNPVTSSQSDSRAQQNLIQQEWDQNSLSGLPSGDSEFVPLEAPRLGLL